jgi:hypothetical protein
MFFFDNDSDIIVLGIAGKAGAGKDFLAKMVSWQMGFIPLPMASHFKVEVAVENPTLPIDEVLGLVERRDEVRHILQTKGVEEGRNIYGDNYWCQHVEAWMYHFHKYGYHRFVIPDVRFPNEVNWIQRLGGKVIRATGRGGLSGQLGKHVSEVALDAYDESLYDAVFDNSPELDLSAKERFTGLVRELFNIR